MLEKVGLALLLIFVAYTSGRMHEKSRQESARERVRIELAQRDSTIIRLRGDSAVLVGQFRVDTLQLTSWKVRWRTLTDTLPPDTVQVPGKVVREIVHTADSTINSCEDPLQTCMQIFENAETRVNFERNRAKLAIKLAQATPMRTKLKYGALGVGVFIAGKFVLNNLLYNER